MRENDAINGVLDARMYACKSEQITLKVILIIYNYEITKKTRNIFT